MVGWQDSALIRAARAGRCLVVGSLVTVVEARAKRESTAKVDEADKAPLEAKSILVGRSHRAKLQRAGYTDLHSFLLTRLRFTELAC